MSTTTLVLQITEQHISKGRPLKSDHCPVALCVNEIVLPDYTFVTTRRRFYIFKAEDVDSPVCNSLYTGINHLSVQEFVKNFDAGKVVYSQKITVDIPTEYIKHEPTTEL